jgi:hypothetical protein
MDIVLAARRHLAAQTDLTSLLGTSTDPDYDTWIFRHKLPVTVENSSQSALVLRQGPIWTSRNTHNTLAFPRLVCEVYTDPFRGLTQPGPQTTDSYSMCIAICSVLSLHLHRIDGGFLWDSLRIVNSKQLSEPVITEDPESDGMVCAVLEFAVSLG